LRRPLPLGCWRTARPKRDWEFIKGWPAFALFVISGTVAQMEQAPKWVPGEFKFNSFCVAGFAPRTGGNKAWNGCCGDAARLASTWLSRLRTTPKQLMKDRDDKVVKALSWLLRGLIPWESQAVEAFLDEMRPSWSCGLSQKCATRCRPA